MVFKSLASASSIECFVTFPPPNPSSDRHIFFPAHLLESEELLLHLEPLGRRRAPLPQDHLLQHGRAVVRTAATMVVAADPAASSLHLLLLGRGRRRGHDDDAGTGTTRSCTRPTAP